MAEIAYRTEELAELVGVDSSRVREWCDLGLLVSRADGRFGVDAVERVRLIRFAADRGIDAAEIAALSELQGTDVLDRYIELVGEPRPPGRSVEESAHLAGLPVDLARRFWAAGGMGDAELFAEDVEMMRIAAAVLDLGLPADALHQLLTVFADATTRLADAASRLFHIHVHEELKAAGVTGTELVETVRATGEPMVELIEPTILYFHRRAWRRALLDDLVVHLREDLSPQQRPLGEVPVAVLFVDLASFTPLTEAMGDVEAANVLARFADLVRVAASTCEGRVLKQIGDEFMVVFPTAESSVRCGLDIVRRARREHHFPAVRLGAHSGTALYREADYIGATVNIAARVADEAARGQFVTTHAVRVQVEEIPELRWVPLGRHDLKGITEPVELYEVQPVDAPLARTVDPVCGMELDQHDREVPVVWRGRDISFCSSSCRDRFLETPERYADRPSG